MLNITPAPWKLAGADTSSLIKQLPAAPPKPFVPPKIYGRDAAPESDGPIPKLIATRPLELRCITNVALLPRNIVLSNVPDTRVLPPTFIRRGMAFHGGITNDDQRRYRPRSLASPETFAVCRSPVYLSDTDFPDVYGHVLLEVLPSLWGLDASRERAKNLVVASSITMSSSYASMFRCLDVDPEKVLKIDRPIVAAEGYFPDASIYRRQWVHPAAREVFAKLKRLGVKSAISRPKRIYVSRSKVAARNLTNETQVERVFRDLGFEIIHPQEMSIEDQIAVFSDAKMIAGSGGSAMHSAVFAPDSTRVLIVCSEGWLTNADILLSQVPGRLGYVFGAVDDVAQRGSRTRASWTVDVEAVCSAASQHFGIRMPHALKRVSMRLDRKFRGNR